MSLALDEIYLAPKADIQNCTVQSTSYTDISAPTVTCSVFFMQRFKLFIGHFI